MIKLSKTGKTNKKMFRLIISEKSRDPFGSVLEILGSYNPHSKDLIAKTERIKHWLSKGAQMTATVNNLLIEKNIIKGDKVAASKAGKKKKAGKDKKETKAEIKENEKNSDNKAETDSKQESKTEENSGNGEQIKAETETKKDK